MKKYLTIFVILIFSCCTVTHAQTKLNVQNNHEQMLQYNRALVHSIILHQELKRRAAEKNAAKTTNTSERLITITGIDSLGNALSDSTHFIYRGNRSSTFDFDDMEYKYWPYDEFDYTWPMGSFSELFVDEMDLSDVLYDTMNSDGIPYTITTYNANNKPIEYYAFPTKNIYTYNANQQLSATFFIVWNGNSWDTTAMRQLTYSNDKIVTDSVRIVDGLTITTAKWLYNYDNVGNLTEIDGPIYANGSPNSLLSTGKWLFVYNPDNTLQKDSVGDYINGEWVTTIKDSVGYTAGINYVTYKKETDYVYKIVLENREHINNGLPDSLYYHEYGLDSGNIMIAENHTYSYDSYNNPVYERIYNFIDTEGNNGYYNSAFSTILYYYQTFNEAVKNIANQLLHFTVYPNPTANEINISQTGMQPGTRTTISLINALGQTVRTESLPWMSSTETISVAGLVPGNYWLIIQDKNGTVLERQMVVKQ